MGIALVLNHTGRKGGYKQFKQDLHPEFLPHAPHLSMQSASPHRAKPQGVLTSSVMVQISQKATSCVSVLKPEREMIQPPSGSVAPVMVQQRQLMEKWDQRERIHVLHV